MSNELPELPDPHDATAETAVEPLMGLADALAPDDADLIDDLMRLPTVSSSILTTHYGAIFDAASRQDRSGAHAALSSLQTAMQQASAAPPEKRPRVDAEDVENVAPPPATIHLPGYRQGRPKQVDRTDFQKAHDKPMAQPYNRVVNVLEVGGGAVAFGPLASGPHSNLYRQRALVSTVRPLLLTGGPKTAEQLASSRAAAAGGGIYGGGLGEAGAKEMQRDARLLASALASQARIGGSGVVALAGGAYKHAPRPLQLDQVARLLAGYKKLMVEDTTLHGCDEEVAAKVLRWDSGLEDPPRGVFSMLHDLDAREVVDALEQALISPPELVKGLATAITIVRRYRRALEARDG